MVCDRDCFDCKYDDCVQEVMSPEERQEIRDRDIKYGLVNNRNGKPNTYYYNHQEKAKAKALEYYRKNRDQILERQRMRYAEKESVKAMKREYKRKWRNTQREQVNDS